MLCTIELYLTRTRSKNFKKLIINPLVVSVAAGYVSNHAGLKKYYTSKIFVTNISFNIRITTTTQKYAYNLGRMVRYDSRRKLEITHHERPFQFMLTVA